MDISSAADLFFVISSVGFIIVFIVLGILLYYLIQAVRAWKNLVEKIEGSIDKVGDRIEKNVEKVGYAGQEIIDEMRHSAAFRFLFKPRK